AALPVDETATEPTWVPSTRNAAVPLMPAKPVTPAGTVGVTVAVKVTCWLALAGLGETVREVLVVTWTTSRLTGAEVLGVKAVSPPERAVTWWVPAVRLEVVNVAEPAIGGAGLIRVPVPTAVPSTRNVTVPEGMTPKKTLASTLAVNVTVWPTVAGFGETV